MKEISSVIREGLFLGLRRDSRNPRNSGWLTQLVNAKVIRDAGVPDLVAFEPIATPVSDATLTAASITKTFPFPQLIRGQNTTFLLNNNTIWTVNESTGAITQLTTYDPFDPNTGKAITADGSWHMMDFHDTYMFFNGTSVIFRSNRETMFGHPDKVFTTSDITIQTGCDFMGRGVLGGFDPTDFYTSEWTDFWRDWTSRQPSGFSFPTAPGKNFVMWSSIGGGDLLNIFYNKAASEGLVDSEFSINVPLLFEYMKRNEAGFMPMPFQGNVFRCKTLGKNVMVYGEDGIAVMPLSGSTLGLKRLARFGIADRGAVGGHDEEHVFLDESGYLWRIDANLKFEKLGYQEFFTSMLGGDIVVSYDIGEDEYYICDSSEGFVLTKQGLAEHTYLITSSEYFNGGAGGIFLRPGGGDDAKFKMATDVFNMGNRGIKSIERLTVEATDTTGMTCKVDWKYKKGDSFTRTSAKPINDEGDVVFPISGVDFRVYLEAADYTKVDTDSIMIHWKQSDKRSIRSRFDTQMVRQQTSPIREIG